MTNKRETIVSDLVNEAFQLREQVAALQLQLDTAQKRQIVSIIVAAVFAILNVLGLDVPVVPTV